MRTRQGSAGRLAAGLGWASLAIGAAELFGARALAPRLGLAGREALLRGFGVREIATGIGLLTSTDRTPWLWGRVAGDLLDAATLAEPLLRGGRGRAGAALALAAVGGIAVLDLVTADALRTERHRLTPPLRDYSTRSGFPRPAAEMRGAARRIVPTPEARLPDATRAA